MSEPGRTARRDRRFDRRTEAGGAIVIRDPDQVELVPERRPMRRGSTVTVQGAWRMVEFELWDLDTIELMGPAIIEFG